MPMPDTRLVPFMEMKMSHSTGLYCKKVITNYDESLIVSFDPEPTKDRTDLSYEKQLEFEFRILPMLIPLL